MTQMTPAGRVFVSYSRHDQAFVDRLLTDLRSYGLELWVDRENIAAGTSWQTEIESALFRSSALLYIITPSSVRSAWMTAELDAAAKRSITVIPVLAADVPLDLLPPFVKSLQWADFRSDYDRGLVALLGAFGIKARASGQSIPTPSPTASRTKGYAFLSYAEPDRDFVGDLKPFLREHQYSYWDYEESDRDYHTQLFLELEGIISEASATLCIISESWKRSQWTVKEFFFSQDVGTPVFLLKAKPIGPTLATAGMTYIDFTKNDSDGFSKLERELKRKGL